MKRNPRKGVKVQKKCEGKKVFGQQGEYIKQEII